MNTIEEIIAYIREKIYNNGVQKITGNYLQDVLVNVADALEQIHTDDIGTLQRAIDAVNEAKAALNGSSSEDFAAKVMHAFQVISDTSVIGNEVVGETVAGDKLQLHNPDNNALTDIVPGGQSEDIEVVAPQKSGTLARQEDVDAAVSQLGQKVDKIGDIENIDTRSLNIVGPKSAYVTIYEGYIPTGAVIENKTNGNVGIWYEGAANYTSISKNRAVCIQTPVVKIQNLSTAMTADHWVRVIGLLEGDFASIRPVESLLVSSKNIFNPYAEDVSLNSVLGDGGNTGPNSSYHTSGHIRVKEGETYSFSINGAAQNVRILCFLDANNVALSSMEKINSFTAPAGCKTIRFSIAKGSFYSVQLEAASSPTGYVPFSEKIKEALLPSIVVTGAQMNAIRLSRVLAQNGELTTPINIYKGILLSAKITGTIESVLMGLGINGYYGRWIEVTQTQVILWKQSGQAKAPQTHGITLGAFTTIELSKDDNTGNFKFRLINDYGDLFEWDMTNIGLAGGNPKFKNAGTQSIGVQFTVFPRDLSAKVWGFGDSYFSFQDPARWVYYAISWGYDKWLINALGGEASAAGLTNLQTLINTGARPEYVLWCYGMNDGADTTVPDATWLANTQEMIQLCENNQITPILATIPTIPSKSHAQKNAWVRASGYRYVDFAEYVEANGSDYWRGWGTDDQLLGSDETHPTQKGAKVLWQAVLNYFPEIATNY